MLVRVAKKLASGRFEWDFGHGFSSYKREQAAVAQDIETSLYEFKYDCFFALQNGIDWITRLGKHNQRDQLDRDVQQTIQSRYGVLGVDGFSSTVVDRRYICECNVYTIFSETPYPLKFTQGVSNAQ